jgi:hypothetical protein
MYYQILIIFVFILHFIRWYKKHSSISINNNINNKILDNSKYYNNLKQKYIQPYISHKE